MVQDKQRILFQPATQGALLKGAEQVAHLLGATLGPKARTVAVAPLVDGTRGPEFLDDGATIARRLLGISDPFANMGAMLLRDVALRVKEEVGDGSARAVVITAAAMREAQRFVAAGASPMLLRNSLERLLPLVVDALQAQAEPLSGADEVVGLATAASGDAEIGRLLGEVFEIVGAEGVILVQETSLTHCEREYVEGGRWESGYLSPYLVTDEQRMEARQDKSRILVTNRSLSRSAEIQPIIERLLAAGEQQICVIAPAVEGEALGLLVENKLRGKVQALAVGAPGSGERAREVLADIATLTGARYVQQELGERVEDVTVADLGRARVVWADRRHLAIVGGGGDPKAIRLRARQLRRELPKIEGDFERRKARERLGTLQGGTAILWVGATTESEREEKKVRAEATVNTVRAAVEEGNVPGGGAALLTAARALNGLSFADNDAVAAKVLARALEEPTRCIAANGGHEPNAVLAKLAEAPAGWGFDVATGSIVSMRPARIVDPVKVTRIALQTAISAAATALTTDVLIHRVNGKHQVGKGR